MSGSSVYMTLTAPSATFYVKDITQPPGTTPTFYYTSININGIPQSEVKLPYTVKSVSMTKEGSCQIGVATDGTILFSSDYGFNWYSIFQFKNIKNNFINKFICIILISYVHINYMMMKIYKMICIELIF